MNYTLKVGDWVTRVHDSKPCHVLRVVDYDSELEQYGVALNDNEAPWYYDRNELKFYAPGNVDDWLKETTKQ
jgi:hypothetical protein